jgi:hypothetical protein
LTHVSLYSSAPWGRVSVLAVGSRTWRVRARVAASSRACSTCLSSVFSPRFSWRCIRVLSSRLVMTAQLPQSVFESRDKGDERDAPNRRRIVRQLGVLTRLTVSLFRSQMARNRRGGKANDLPLRCSDALEAAYASQYSAYLVEHDIA